jgi:glucosamine--fructose-6-phosphate aminotransferase (isomerizing)
MLAQIESLPALLRNEFDSLDQQARAILTHDEILTSKTLIITGCGDSYFAGLAAEWAFSRLAHRPAQAISAMGAARFGGVDQARNFPGNPLVMAISVSGTVARTVEAVQIGRAAGARTIGLTGDPASPLGQAAEKVFNCSIPSVPHSPGVRSYRISLLALYLLAIHFGEVSGKLNPEQAQKVRAQLKGTADAIEQSLEALDERTRRLAEQVADHQNFVFVGHGPNYGTALFSAAKVIEAAGRFGCGQDSEEWAHLQYFITAEAQTPTFFFAPADQGQDRLLELMEPMRRTGRLIVAVTPAADTRFKDLADWQLPIAGEVAPLFSPLVYPLAAELFSAHLAEVLGVQYFGKANPAYLAGNNTIRSSRVMDAVELAPFKKLP